MIASRPALQQIEAFLQRKRFAAIGVSRNPRDFSRRLFAEFRTRGYDIVPVNPQATSIDDVPCFPTVRDITPRVDAAILLTPAAVSGDIADQCIQAGIQQVWMYRATGAGAVSLRAIVACQLNGIAVIAGECPFMFFPQTGFPHNVHGFCRKMIGTYPR